MKLHQEARHDLVAFVNSFWAIQWERADLLNHIHNSDVEVICSQCCLLCEHDIDNFVVRSIVLCGCICSDAMLSLRGAP